MPREGHDDAGRGVRYPRSISIHVPREGHDRSRRCRTMASAISIHVPREGHDFVGDVDFTALNDISIHVPREGHDRHTSFLLILIRRFQSTCPARGTTVLQHRAARRSVISIHVPREGHDADAASVQLAVLQFQSTCPARGTTRPRADADGAGEHFNPRAPRGARLKFSQISAPILAISIHVPREGHD